MVGLIFILIINIKTQKKEKEGVIEGSMDKKWIKIYELKLEEKLILSHFYQKKMFISSSCSSIDSSNFKRVYI